MQKAGLVLLGKNCITQPSVSVLEGESKEVKEEMERTAGGSGGEWRRWVREKEEKK